MNNGLIKKNIFNPILMNLGEVIIPMGSTTSPTFIKIGLKTKKFFISLFFALSKRANTFGKCESRATLPYIYKYDHISKSNIYVFFRVRPIHFGTLG